MTNLWILIYKMSFNRVPQGFMEGSFIAPHSFSDPQNPKHGEYVNLQLRNDLYFSTLHEISNVEFGLMQPDTEQWVQVQSFKPCMGEVGWLGKTASDYKRRRGRTLAQRADRKVDLISCQQWDIAYHRGKQKRNASYRVHVLQSDNDIFKTEIFPPTFWRTLKDLLIN